VCKYCAIGSPQVSQNHTRVLQLIALIEHPDALPAEAVLRIAGELLAWTWEAPRFRCEAMARPGNPMDAMV